MTDVPTLAQMTPRAQAVALAYFEAGLIEGWCRGWDAHDRHEDVRYQRFAAMLGKPSKGVPYADLCEIRGEHERADAQRRLLRERGIT